MLAASVSATSVSRAGGALDSHALRVANLIVGNEAAAAGLEITFGGCGCRFNDDRVIAWCGGRFDVVVAGMAIIRGPADIRARRRRINDRAAGDGCRAWLAVSGGINVPQVLGSRSTDLRARFGGLEGRALRASGDVAANRTVPVG